MTAFVETSIADLVEFIVDNRGRSCPTADSGFPLIATNCLKSGRRDVVFENVRFVDEITYATWFRSHPQPGDVLFVCKGSPGRVAVVPDPVPYCIAQDMVALRANSATNPAYLYYRLCAPDIRAGIENMHVGTMIPHFKKGDFGKLRFLVHKDLSEQRAIAKVLTVLDDKIEAETAIASAALDLADSIFESARARCSGQTESYEDLAEVNGGGTPKTSVKEFWNGSILWATPTDVTGLTAPYLDQTARRITESGLKSISSKLYPAGSILMTSRATIGAFAIAQKPVAVNQGFIVVNARDPHMQWWLFHDMRSRVEEFLSHANGATFLELSRGKFKKLLVRVPGPEQAAHFNAAADSLHASAAAALAQSVRLAASRDVLLPLLMSGKIAVKTAEVLVEEVV